jgi:nitrite reductase/ring-hydroxylating ferredoxin subunit
MDESKLYAICAAGSIAPGWIHPFTLEQVSPNGASEPISLLIARDKGQNFFAYRNVCPHQQHVIYGKPAKCLSIGGLVFACRWHQAKFNAQTGLCIGGPCEGAQLQSYPTALVDGKVCISGLELASPAVGPAGIAVTS